MFQVRLACLVDLVTEQQGHSSDRIFHLLSPVSHIADRTYFSRPVHAAPSCRMQLGHLQLAEVRDSGRMEEETHQCPIFLDCIPAPWLRLFRLRLARSSACHWNLVWHMCHSTWPHPNLDLPSNSALRDVSRFRSCRYWRLAEATEESVLVSFFRPGTPTQDVL